jgi:hypothetical protein
MGGEDVTAPAGDPTSPYPRVLGLQVYRTGMSLISCNLCSSQVHTAFWCHKCLCTVFLLVDEINTCLHQKNRIYVQHPNLQAEGNLESRELMFRYKLTHVINQNQLRTSRVGHCALYGIMQYNMPSAGQFNLNRQNKQSYIGI